MGILNRIASILDTREREPHGLRATVLQTVVALNDRVSQRTSALATEIGVIQRLETREQETALELAALVRDVEGLLYIWQETGALRMMPKKCLLEARLEFFQKQLVAHRQAVAILREDLEFARLKLQRSQELASDLTGSAATEGQQCGARLSDIQALADTVAAHYLEAEHRVAEVLARAPRAAGGGSGVDPRIELERMRAQLESQGVLGVPALLSTSAIRTPPASDETLQRLLRARQQRTPESSSKSGPAEQSSAPSNGDDTPEPAILWPFRHDFMARPPAPVIPKD